MGIVASSKNLSEILREFYPQNGIKILTPAQSVGDLVKTYKFEHQPTETAMQGRNLRYVSARASFRAGKRKNGNYRLRQNHR
jgi:hypothetical protein